MNILCFNEKYTSSADIEAVKNFSSTIVKEYIKNNGELTFRNLLNYSLDYDQLALRAIYKEFNISYDPIYILYKFGGKGNMNLYVNHYMQNSI